MKLLHVALMVAIASTFVSAQSSANESEWSQLNGRVIQLFQEGKYPLAVPIAEKAITKARNAFGNDSKEVFLSLNNLGLIYKMQSRYDEALELYVEALSIAEGLVGKSHSDLIVPLNNLAFIYKALGQQNKVDEIYSRLSKLSK